LTEFVALNGGRIQIVSDAGYWEQQAGEVSTDRLGHPYPGTVVSVEIDTLDARSYVLATELSPHDIF
jgi:hypothetical protein